MNGKLEESTVRVSNALDKRNSDLQSLVANLE
jgi:hypothetical protein